MIGTVLAGKYRVEAQLFTDKLGVAYRGRSVTGGSSLLILVLDSSIQPTAEQLDGILAVSRQVRDLNHPSLVPTVDWLRLDDGIALVSPRCDAIPFEEFCKGGVGLAETVDLASQVGEAVQVAREAGISHKDLSAHSIFVSVPAEGGQVPRIFFWGYDVLLPPYSVGRKDDKFWGTPEYMAPELCSGKGWNPQSDVYSIGILLFQMVTGKPPFISANYNTTMKRQIYEKPLPLNLLKRGIPHIAEFEKVVFEALQKVVAKRPESTRALSGMLSEFRRSMIPEAAVTPLPPITWPEVAATGTAAAAAAPAVAAAAPEGTLTFRGLGDAAAQATAEARVQGSTTPDTLRFQPSEVPEKAEEPEKTVAPEPAPAPAEVASTATLAFDASALAATSQPAKVVEEIALGPTPKPEVKEEKRDKKEKKDKKAEKAEKAAAEKAAAEKAAAEKAERAAAEKAAADKAASERAEKAAAEKAEKAASKASTAGATATTSEATRRKIEEQTRQLEETGDDWFMDAQESPKGASHAPAPEVLQFEKPKPAAGRKEWKLWAVIGVVTLAVVAVLIWVLTPGTPEDAKKQLPAAAPKTETLTQVPMDKTPADAAKQKQDDSSAKDEAAKKAEEAKKAEAAAKEAAAKKAADEAAAAAKKAADEAAAKAAQEAAAKKAADEAAAKAAADAAAAAAAKKAADEAAANAGNNAAAQEAARKAAEQAAAQELAAKKAAEEAARKAAQQEAAAKKAADEAAKKAAADAAAKKAAADAAAKKAAEDAAKKSGDDAAKKKAAEDAAKKAAADAAAKKAAADAAAKKAAEDAAKKKAAEDAAKKGEDTGSEGGSDADSQAKKFKAMGIKALKKGNCALAVRYFESAKKYAPDDATIDKFIEKCNDNN